MRILVINGPNINMLGVREPDIYGKESYFDLKNKIKMYAKELKIKVRILQSNHEGDLVDMIQAAYKNYDGIVINPGAYTHTSIALYDVLKATSLLAIEVHISDPDTREDFRKTSYIRGACAATVKGKGTDGYLEAIDLICKMKNYGEKKTSDGVF